MSSRQVHRIAGPIAPAGSGTTPAIDVRQWGSAIMTVAVGLTTPSNAGATNTTVTLECSMDGVNNWTTFAAGGTGTWTIVNDSSYKLEHRVARMSSIGQINTPDQGMAGPFVRVKVANGHGATALTNVDVYVH